MHRVLTELPTTEVEPEQEQRESGWKRDGHYVSFQLGDTHIATEVRCVGGEERRCALDDGRCEVKAWHDSDPGLFIECMDSVRKGYREPINGPVEIEWWSSGWGGEESEWELWWRPVGAA